MGFDTIDKGETWCHIIDRKYRLKLLANGGVWNLNELSQTDVHERSGKRNVNLSPIQRKCGIVVVIGKI